VKFNRDTRTILHVIDTTGPGGAETVFIELASRLRKCGFRSVVVICGPGWVCDQLRMRELTPYVIPAKGAFNWRFLLAILKIIRSEQVDIIQSHLLGSNVYCAIAGLIARKPVIATFHGMVDVGPAERFRAAKLWLMNRGVSRFVCVSKSLRDAIDREGLLDPSRCEIIYNGIDLSKYGRIDKRELRDRLGLSSDAILIGSLGNVRPAKGYDLLLRAARRVIDINSQAHFIIAGDPKSSLQRELDKLSADLNIENHVHFIGFCNDSAKFLGQLDYFLLTSISEGLSIATIEALATGLPAVLTLCGGPEEIARAGIDAVMVAPQESAIATGLLQLLEDEELAERMSASGKSSVAAKFAIGIMLERYMDLYASALT